MRPPNHPPVDENFSSKYPNRPKTTILTLNNQEHISPQTETESTNQPQNETETQTGNSGKSPQEIADTNYRRRKKLTRYLHIATHGEFKGAETSYLAGGRPEEDISIDRLLTINFSEIEFSSS